MGHYRWTTTSASRCLFLSFLDLHSENHLTSYYYAIWDFVRRAVFDLKLIKTFLIKLIYCPGITVQQ